MRLLHRRTWWAGLIGGVVLLLLIGCGEHVPTPTMTPSLLPKQTSALSPATGSATPVRPKTPGIQGTGEPGRTFPGMQPGATMPISSPGVILTEPPPTPTP